MLVDAITRYAAGSKLEDNAWATLAKEAINFFSPEDFLAGCEIAEAEFRSNNPGEQIPGAWRSAKSVVKNAKVLGITLLSDDGAPKGKSAIQAAIKAAKVPAPVAKTPEEVFKIACDVAYKKGVAFDEAMSALERAYGRA